MEKYTDNETHNSEVAERTSELLEAAEQSVQERVTFNSLFTLGGVKFAANLSHALTVQAIRGLETFQKTNGYLNLGYDSFAAFLDNSEYSPMSKSTYYERKQMLEKEGDDLYELLNRAGVSLRARKQLADGEIEVSGDTVRIAGEETDLQDLPKIRDLIKNLADTNSELKATNLKAEEQVKTLHETIETGQKEYEDLRRAFDAYRDADPFVNTYLKTLKALTDLRREAEALAPEDRSRRGLEVIQQLWEQIVAVRETLKADGFSFAETEEAGDIDPRVLAVMNDLNDEDETNE